jgi:F0F1-type ATP synthase membrane subunit b/b'
MDDTQILQHLIEVEKNAARIVEDAQKEAAARETEADRACRAAFESAYTQGYAALEADYTRQVGEINCEYEATLDECRKALGGEPSGAAQFAALSRRFLLDEAGGAARPRPGR